MTRKEELLKELAEIEEAEKQFTVKYKSFVGKYFKYRNCYPYSKNDYDYWYSYYRITSITPNDIICNGNGISCRCTTLFFEEDKDGVIKFDPSHMTFIDVLEEISKAEYENAFKLIMNKLTNMMR